MMNLNDYQDATELTAVYPSGRCADQRLPPVGVLYTAIGLSGEVGEVNEKLKKYIRENDEQYLDDVERELGDVLWYWARLCDELGLDAEDVAQSNLDKLEDRQVRDKLTGEGDDR